jgi:hypothetical protein
MTDQFYGSVQANAEKVLYNLEEMHGNLNGQHTSAKKKKEEPNSSKMLKLTLRKLC